MSGDFWDPTPAEAEYESRRADRAEAERDQWRALADDLAAEVAHLRRIIDADHGHLQPLTEPDDDVLARYLEARER